ncbi:MAG TPA: ACT domain-containing protein [Anaeromyxobacter sp.]
MSWLPGRFAVCRLDAPPSAPFVLSTGLFSVTRTPGEVSVVCREESMPPGARCETGWSAMRLSGPIPFEETGVLASLAGPLARAGISMFAVSTYDTDYVLVRAADAAAAQRELEAAGFTFRPPPEGE